MSLYSGTMWQPSAKSPAWSALTTSFTPTFESATTSEANALAGFSVIGEQKVQRILLGGSFQNMWRAQDVFVRWTAGPLNATHIENYELCGWLYERGANVPQPLIEPQACPKLSLALGQDEGFVQGMRYHDFRTVRPETSELVVFAKELHRLHKILTKHQQLTTWESASQQRIDRLVAVRKQLAAGDFSAGPDHSHLQHLCRDETLDFERKASARIASHGDLNLGNVLMEGTGRLVFIDFEDVLHSVLPVEFELAYAMERYIFVRLEDDASAHNAAQAFLQAYGAPRVNWLNVVQSLNLRSLCTLALLEQLGSSSHPDEWHKFFDLFQRAENSEQWRQLNA